MGSYIPAAPAEQREMLEAIGLRDFRELYRDVPESMYPGSPSGHSRRHERAGGGPGPSGHGGEESGVFHHLAGRRRL